MSITLKAGCPSPIVWAESFDSGLLLVPDEATLTEATVDANYYSWYQCQNCNDPLNPAGEWCYEGAGTPAPGYVCLTGTYFLPRMSRPGIWTVTLTATLDTAGSPPAPAPDCWYDCWLQWNFSGVDYANPGSYTMIQSNDYVTCTAETALTQDIEIWVPYPNQCTCIDAFNCAVGPPAVGWSRGGSNPDGVGWETFMWSSYNVRVTGVWVSDTP